MKKIYTLKEKVDKIVKMHKKLTSIAGTEVAVCVFLKHGSDEAKLQGIPITIVNGKGQIVENAFISLYLQD